MKKYKIENNEFFDDEILLAKATKDAYLDQEYTEFEQGVLSGRILEMDCKNPQWLDCYYKIRKIHSKQLIKQIAKLSCNKPETNHSGELKNGDWRDLDPDDE